MSTQDSETNVVKHETQLASAGRELVHDVATPLATLQLNLQVLSTFLPALMEHCQAIGLPPQMSQERLNSLASLPDALDADIRKIRHAVRLFSSVLVPASASLPSLELTRGGAQVARPRILLVEDEVVHQEIALKQFGDRFQVDLAASADEALALAAQRTHGLVLLDLMLSGRDARPLIGELRAAGAPHLRIILVSNMPLGAIDAQQLQVDGVLEKPFRLAALEVFLQATGAF